MGLVFAEIELVKGARVFLGPNLNGDEILIAEPVNEQDFCGNEGHWWNLSKSVQSSFQTAQLPQSISTAILFDTREASCRPSQFSAEEYRPVESASPIL